MGITERIKSIFFNETKSDNKKLVVEEKSDSIAQIEQGNAFEDDGDIEKALLIYQHVAENFLDFARAYLNIGNALMKLSQYENAKTAYIEAIRLDPEYAAAHFNLGNSNSKLGKTNEALENYERAIQIKKEFIGAYIAKGNVYATIGNHEVAESCFRAALVLKPDFIDVYKNLADSLMAQNKFELAKLEYARMIALDAKSPEAYLGLGNACFELGSIEEAQNYYRKLNQLETDNLDILNLNGIALRNTGDFDSAIVSFQKILKVSKEFSPAYNNLGLAYSSKGDHSSAIECFNKAILISKDRPEYYVNLGDEFAIQGDLEKALECTAKALSINRNFLPAHNNAGGYLKDMGRIKEGAESFFKTVEINPQYNDGYSNYLFCVNHQVGLSVETIFCEHQKFGQFFESALRSAWPHHKNRRDKERFLKIGIVSGDLANHAVASFFEPILACLAKKPMLHIHVYNNNPAEDSMTLKMKSYARKWIKTANISDDVLADLIFADSIDILIDLSGHTAKNRLLTFARKPAPIQISWLGYPGTTGLSAMDYYIGDRYFVPVDKMANQFVEKLALLPITTTFQPDKSAPDVNELPALTNKYLTFGSFNRPDKINREVVAHWATLLKRLPTSKMILGGLPAKGSYQHLIDWFSSEGVTVDRLFFHRRSNMQTYLALHHQVDICLDTFPYTGGTTTNHALWMGVPTLTFIGDTPAGRQSTSNLLHVDLQDLFVADTKDEFILKGLALADHIEQLAQIRAGLRKRFKASAFCQPELVADSFERAIRYMWERWCDDLSPETFEVCVQDKIYSISESDY